MPKQTELPEFEWGHIIQVPPIAICRHGIDPAYGRFYGVIISSGLFWQEQRQHEKKLKTALEKRKNEFIKTKENGPEQPESDDKVNSGHTSRTDTFPKKTSREDAEITHRLLESAPTGQYLVALISKSEIYPGLDTRITSECRIG